MFVTPFGRFGFLRTPFGILPAPEVFHRVVGDAVGNMTNVMHYIDDILVWGKTKEEHDQKLQEVLEKIKESRF